LTLVNILYYEKENGRTPFLDWFNHLETLTQVIIAREIDKAFIDYNFRNVKSLGGGLYEVKINYGPGFRVYFAHTINDCFLILLGGNKSSQKRDINLAQKYWSLYGR